MAFADFQDAKRVLDVLGKRLARYELTLHPDKTRFVDFHSNRPDGKDHPDTDGTTFTFLGFCHVWGKSRKGKNVVRQVTAKKRYARALAVVSDWRRTHRHLSIPRPACPTGCEDAGPLCLLRYIGQLSTTQLVRPQGCEDLAQMAVATREPIPMGSVQRPPNAAPSASSSDRPPLHRCERISPVKNRMLEIGTSGTVRGGNILTYSTLEATAFARWSIHRRRAQQEDARECRGRCSVVPGRSASDRARGARQGPLSTGDRSCLGQVSAPYRQLLNLARGRNRRRHRLIRDGLRTYAARHASLVPNFAGWSSYPSIVAISINPEIGRDGTQTHPSFSRVVVR
jgi:hypothetical protein